MNFTLDKLKDVPPENRGATFTTVAVALSPEGKKYIFEGSLRGQLLSAPRVECQPKMPYSAIFLADGLEKVLAEMQVEEENAISHRGKAFRKVRDFFSKILN